MSTTLPDLTRAWHKHWEARWRRWEGVRFEETHDAWKKLKRINRTLTKGIYPRGKAVQRLLWINRDKTKYL